MRPPHPLFLDVFVSLLQVSSSLPQDPSPVQERGPPKTVSVEDSFKSCASLAGARSVLSVLAPDLLARLREELEVSRAWGSGGPSLLGSTACTLQHTGLHCCYHPPTDCNMLPRKVAELLGLCQGWYMLAPLPVHLSRIWQLATWKLLSAQSLGCVSSTAWCFANCQNLPPYRRTAAEPTVEPTAVPKPVSRLGHSHRSARVRATPCPGCAWAASGLQDSGRRAQTLTLKWRFRSHGWKRASASCPMPQVGRVSDKKHSNTGQVARHTGEVASAFWPPQ